MSGKHLSGKKRILPGKGGHLVSAGGRGAEPTKPGTVPVQAVEKPAAEAVEAPLTAGKKGGKAKAPREKKGGKRSTVGIILRLLFGILLAAVLLLNVFTYVFSVVTYYGDSMEPTLSGGQTLIILRTDKIEEGDIVAFYYTNKVIVRRVICTGDKQISIAEDGVVSINGEVIMEDYVSELSPGQCDISFPYSVPGGRFFVMGDNRVESMDSRLEIIGAISPDRIIGKIIFVK